MRAAKLWLPNHKTMILTGVLKPDRSKMVAEPQECFETLMMQWGTTFGIDDSAVDMSKTNAHLNKSAALRGAR